MINHYKPNKQLGVKKQNKFVGAGLVIRVANSQFLMFKTRPALVVYIFSHLLIPSCSLRKNLTNRRAAEDAEVRETESYTFECILVLIQTKKPILHDLCSTNSGKQTPPYSHHLNQISHRQFPHVKVQSPQFCGN